MAGRGSCSLVFWPSMLLIGIVLHALSATTAVPQGGAAGSSPHVGQVPLSTAGARTPTCCQRHPKMLSLGYDPSGSTEVFQDVGECVRTCSASSSDGGRGGRKTCSRRSTCYPSRFLMETVSLENGTREIAVVDTCSCLSARDNSECSVKRQEHVYNPGTTFEKIVNHGACLASRQCSNGTQVCAPSSYKTNTVRQPGGGRRCVKVIKQCSCKPLACSRRQHKVAVAAKVWERNTVTGQLQLVNKTLVIDVGRCEGQCRTPSRRCFGPRQDMCLQLTVGTRTCYPGRTERVQFTSALTGEAAHMVSIRECSCLPAKPSVRHSFHQRMRQQLGLPSANVIGR